MSDADRPGGQPQPYGPQDPGRPPAGPQQPQGQPGPYGPAGGSPYGPQPYGQPAGPAGPQNPYASPGSPRGPQPGPYAGPGQPYPPQPGQPYPGQPYPGQPYPGQPGQPGPYGALPPGGPGRPTRNRLPLIIGGAALALLLVVGVAVAALRGGPDATSSGSTDPSTSASAPAAADKPSDAVRGYLEALAAKDAPRALGYLDDPPADTTFLSRPVLEASASKAAISAVEVPEVTDKYAYKVTAHYNLGQQAVSEDYPVTETGGAWKVSRAVTKIDLSYQRDETLPMLINGVEVKNDEVALFPGSYTFTTKSKWVTYGDGATLTLTGPSDYDTPRLTPTINAAGKAAFLKATRAAFGKCLAQHAMRPSGCPNRLALRSGQKIEESTVRWGVSNDPFKNARVSLDSSDPTVAEASFYPSYTFRAKGTIDGQSARFDTVYGLYSFSSNGDLSGDTVKVKLLGH